ncbi:MULTISPECIES: hypothetical protein [Pseudomonas]|uniref:hypothetical protein n=1 Tax=Pseudomonas TaxID=286 RepID=UPI0005006599|nr:MULTISPECIES: hypothetical protein [Pseudomonas]KFJ91686.1 hypothetical protein JF55_11220 [Pseudomonas sp. 1-7]QUN70697.1 hypothetical protein KDB76_29485 [Pseudomonas sp. JS425]
MGDTQAHRDLVGKGDRGKKVQLDSTIKPMTGLLSISSVPVRSVNDKVRARTSIHCGSEPAREELANNAFIQTARALMCNND